ncbi:MAG: Flp pilus assembly complex ATPase component TadA [Deltaproteobacteria bacterium]|nr:Flp pilus assembly complex ATPase component TadA [Deltaproteobacteria bacterium]
MDTQTEIKSRLQEAEVYRSMGLPKESLTLYEGILKTLPTHDGEIYTDIKNKIELLKEDIKEKYPEEFEGFTTEELTGIQEVLTPVEENVPAINDCAFAFKELGLYKEALAEYEKLIRLDFSIESIIHDVCDCLFKLYPSMEIIIQADNFFKKFNFGNAQLAQTKYLLGLELERRDSKEQALYYYETAAELDPQNEKIQKRLNALAAYFATGSKYDYLLNNNKVTTEQLLDALALSKKNKASVEYVLVTQFNVSREDIGKSLTACYRHPFKAFDPDMPTPIELLTNLKKTFLLQDLWVPLGWEKDSVQVLIDDPINLNKVDIVMGLLKAKKAEFFIGIKEDIEAYIKLFYDKKKVTDEVETSDASFDEFDMMPDISFEEEEDRSSEEYSSEFNEASGKVVKLVDQILVAAYRKNISDIHIEPSPITKATTVRFRLDGVCQEYIQVPNTMAKGIISRIKIMAGLDISEKRLPQDGKIKFKRKGIPSFELRVATLPTAGGFEDAVLRILAKAGAMKLDDMGLSQRNLDVMKKIITQPYGLVLVVGPTGSGKTTSLHSALGYINKPDIKIWTAEDPIEITQQGMRQVEAHAKIGLDFARIMRAFLRADPDVIMIGEMRDNETASIGIEASLTGHLVMSTLHTNSAPETITRLLDMGLNPLNFSDAFLGVMAQRLVRKLCDKCKKPYHPTKEEFDDVVLDYGPEYFKRTGIEYNQDFNLYQASGCDACSGTGYRGRLGIHELMEGTPEIKRMIKKQANSEELFIQAMSEGMTTLRQDGIIKSLKGLTDLREVRRVCVT